MRWTCCAPICGPGKLLLVGPPATVAPCLCCWKMEIAPSSRSPPHAGALSESPLDALRSRLGGAAAIVRRNASRASGETRIAFATRTWCNSRRSQRPYTVAADTPSLAATCLTVRSEPIRIGPAIGVRTTGGPKSWGSVGTAWRESARSSCPSRKDCEGLSVAVTGCDVP